MVHAVLGKVGGFEWLGERIEEVQVTILLQMWPAVPSESVTV